MTECERCHVALKRAESERDEYKRLADERLTLWQDARRSWCPNCGFVRPEDAEEWQCAKCGDRVFDSGEHHRDFERARRAETERDDARKQLDKLKEDLRVNLDAVYELTTTLHDMQADRSELVRRYNLARELCDDLRGYTRDWDWKYGASWDAEYQQAFGEACLVQGVFERFSDVERWVDYVVRSRPGTPGCHRAGGGYPPPHRSSFDGQEGFWVYEERGVPMYTWVPDEIAARDTTGRYRAGQKSGEEKKPQ